MNDPIIAEVRASRERIAARWGYDLDRLADHLERERKRTKAQKVTRPSRAKRKLAKAS